MMFGDLKYLEPVMRDAIDNDVIKGGRIAVIYKGETVYCESFGLADAEKGRKMGEGDIFRLFSLTKPITAAAVMKLSEMGKIELRYPVKWFLPTFEDPLVSDEKGTRPAKRDITVADLLTMTSGVCYPEGTPAGMKMGEVWGRQSQRIEKGEVPLSTREFALEMGRCPLAFSPGERWMYGSSADVLGAVVEEVSGMSFGDFLKKEIFDPLGMTDTAFYVPEEKLSCLVQVYDRTENGNLPFTGHNLCIYDVTCPPAFESGGAGLFSTMEDYGIFTKMLMGYGRYNGIKILGRKTVELMTRNFLSDDQIKSLDWDSMKGQGYGCLMRVLRDSTEAGVHVTEGAYGWDGWLGCYLSVDPAEELAMLYFIQQTNSGCTDLTRKLQNVIWSAL